MQISYDIPTHLDVDDFLALVQAVWPGEYDREACAAAVRRTLTVVAWDGGRLVGCVRMLTDGYLFGCVTEILVEPDYQGRGIGRELMERLYDASPTSIFLGAQLGNEEFFEKLGYEPGPKGYVKRKEREAEAPQIGTHYQQWATEDEIQQLEYELARALKGRVLITGSLFLVHVTAMRECGEALLERGLQFDFGEGIRFDGHEMAPDFGLMIREFPQVDDVGREAYLDFLGGLEEADVEDRRILYYDVGFQTVRDAS